MLLPRLVGLGYLGIFTNNPGAIRFVEYRSIDDILKIQYRRNNQYHMRPEYKGVRADGIGRHLRKVYRLPSGPDSHAALRKTSVAGVHRLAYIRLI
jgi:hypothetical protein